MILFCITQLFLGSAGGQGKEALLNGPFLQRLITKIDSIIQSLDDCHAQINTVFSSGAVEGYTEECFSCSLQVGNAYTRSSVYTMSSVLGGPIKFKIGFRLPCVCFRDEANLLRLYKLAMKTLLAENC